jgi:hypothetical protein
MARRRVGGGPIHFSYDMTPEIGRLVSMADAIRINAADWTPLWPRLTEVIIEGVRRTIKSRGAEIANPLCNYGHKWQPADPRYLRRKARAGHGVNDLFVTGRLLSFAATPRGVLRQTQRALTFGVPNLPYARFQNFKKRPFLGETIFMRKTMTEEVRAFLARVVGRAMGGL